MDLNLGITQRFAHTANFAASLLWKKISQLVASTPKDQIPAIISIHGDNCYVRQKLDEKENKQNKEKREKS